MKAVAFTAPPLITLRESGWAQTVSGDVRQQPEPLLHAVIAACCQRQERGK